MIRDGPHHITIPELIDGLPITPHGLDGTIVVRDLVEDSRLAGPGTIFLARTGDAVDGRTFISQAESAGAPIVLSDADGCARCTGPSLECTDPSSVGAEIAHRIHGRPTSRLRLVGITGTNGKTTTAFILRHLLASPGEPCGLISGIEIHDGEEWTEARLTTPQAPELCRYLGRMVRNGCSHAVMEVSSHALDLGRVEPLGYNIGIFTNLSGDHLDHHGDMNSYACSKQKLFASLPEEGCAIININDEQGDFMASAASCHVIECGDGAAARVLCTFEDLRGSLGRFEGPWGSFEASLPLIGRHNLFNALQAVAAAWKCNVPVEHLQRRLSSCPCPRGRLQRVKGPRTAPHVFIDFAHTDAAISSTLQNVRRLLPESSRLHVVFGCGGDRDATKRPRMAAAAARWADRITLTSDNPRNEDPKKILTEIFSGIPADHAEGTIVQPDRAQAIEHAIMSAHSDDVVVIAGKGHERFQLVGSRRISFDDEAVAMEVLHRHEPSKIEFIDMDTIAGWVDGTWLQSPACKKEPIEGIVIDSREVAPGLAFVAIKGDIHDGHDHVTSAIEDGASLVVVERPIESDTTPVLMVKDTRQALAQLARNWRQQLEDVTVIAITGSCGKTTTRSLLQNVLSQDASTCASIRSFNNDIGLPLSILSARPHHKYLVLEAGSSSPGEIDHLGTIAQPDHAIITMVGQSHLQDLESQEGVAREKYSLLPHVRTSAWVRDDPYDLPPGLASKIHRFGASPGHQSTLNMHGSSLLLEDGTTFQVGLPGHHNAMNAVPVIHLARSLGLGDAEIQRGLDQVRPPRGRGRRSSIGEIDFIDESYNANPDSMWAAIDTVLDQSRAGSRIVLVLGDMLELGDLADSSHDQLGCRIASHPDRGSIDLVMLVGQHVKGTVRGLVSSGWPADKLVHEQDVDDEAMSRVASMLQRGDTVLLKASRGLSLERIIELRRPRESEARAV